MTRDAQREDEDTVGADEMTLREHFAPVVRSIKRTVTSRSIQAYAISFLGILVLSASIGGAVIGTYATVQEDFGLCGNPILEVSPVGETNEISAGEARPSFSHFEYEALTPSEQRGFRMALDDPNNEGEIAGTTEHLSVFQSGAIVAYRGAEYYATIGSLNKCVPISRHRLLFSIGGLLVGAGMALAPSLWRRFR